MEFRELTDDEEFFIEEKLRNKKVTYDKEKDVYTKDKGEDVKVSKILWTLFRPRNWAVLVGLIGLLVSYFVINSAQKIGDIVNTDMFTMLYNNPDDATEILAEVGLTMDRLEVFQGFYENYPLIVIGVLVATVILVTLLLLLDTWMSNRSSKNEK